MRLLELGESRAAFLIAGAIAAGQQRDDAGVGVDEVDGVIKSVADRKHAVGAESHPRGLPVESADDGCGGLSGKVEAADVAIGKGDKDIGVEIHQHGGANQTGGKRDFRELVQGRGGDLVFDHANGWQQHI